MLTVKELKYWIFSDIFSLFCVFLSILPEGQLPAQNQQQCQNNVRYIKQATTKERYQKDAMEKNFKFDRYLQQTYPTNNNEPI